MKKQLDVCWPETLSLVQRVNQRLRPVDWDAMAQRVGFRKRKPIKIKPFDLLRAFCVLAFYSKASFDVVAAILGFLNGNTVSKQAVAKRMSATCVDFIRQALYTLLGVSANLPALVKAGAFAPFSRVLIQDSTNISLPANLAEAFPGSRNQSGKTQAVLKIQAIYELLKDSFVQFSISGFTRNDQRSSQDILAVIEKGDLVLRDLGYFVSSVFIEISNRGAFFLSRLHYGITLLHQKENKRLNLLKQLRQYGKLDIQLRLGDREKVPVRLVAVPLPPALASQRRRKARQDRDKRHPPSKERLALLGWEIFITNVPEELWKAETVCEVYGLRWRIEIIFKAWKSHFAITRIPSGSVYQAQAIIYSRLIFITLFQAFLGPLQRYLKNRYTSSSLSLLKLAHFFTEHLPFIVPLFSSAVGIQLLEKLIIRHCTYDKRNNRLNYLEALQCLG